MADTAHATQSGAILSTPTYDASAWYEAVVPGTILTTLVHAGIYPDPMYGENNRPEVIPETLNKSPYWYRTVTTVPASYAGRHIWLNFDGINYTAIVWVNGTRVGDMRGAFARGHFDISANVKPGAKAAIAVLITPQPHPGISHEHTIRTGMGANGGMTALDGATFLSSIGWDWIPAIRDRDTGIWQKVFLSATGDVLVTAPLVTSKLPLPKLDSADLTVKTTLQNIGSSPIKGVLHGSIGAVTFSQPVEIEANASKVVTLDPSTTPALHLLNPRLWWPNGYGPQNISTLKLSFTANAKISDTHDTTFGIREITYEVPDSPSLTLVVNGVKVFIRGGDWGDEDAMKRISPERMDAQIHMHALANMNMIRNWVGQSTSELFYELCDKYGILLWDEFFQANPSDGPNPEDIAPYLANVREKIIRYRNHPSIAVWCARNEGYPPKEIDDALRILLKELEPVRLYQPSSTEGRGVNSGGPYMWRSPQSFYTYTEAFKTELGSTSIPTLESIHGMLARKDWEVIDDAWAEHDFARGASGSDHYPADMAARYGKVLNLADFTRKGQLMNYEAYRAMYEGRNARMFTYATGVITWMSHPAQPSFVWQLYHYDLEPNSSLFAVKTASEHVHVQWNEANDDLEVINNVPTPVTGTVRVSIYALDGSKLSTKDIPVAAAASSVASLGAINLPATPTPVHFVELELSDAAGKPLSHNVYWRANAASRDDLTAMDTMPKANLAVNTTRADLAGKTTLTVTLKNPTTHMAVMTHLQLRNAKTDERILPVFYSDNYISLAPGETRTSTITVDTAELHGAPPTVFLDGWNIGLASSTGIPAKFNTQADPAYWPVTGLPFATDGLRLTDH
jgi:beta-galactosidase/beta-glucuronidase